MTTGGGNNPCNSGNCKVQGRRLVATNFTFSRCGYVVNKEFQIESAICKFTGGDHHTFNIKGIGVRNIYNI